MYRLLASSVLVLTCGVSLSGPVAAVSVPSGTLFKTSYSPRVYLVKGTYAYYMSSSAEIYANGKSWSDLRIIETPENLTFRFSNGSLLREVSNPDVYLVLGGRKYHVRSDWHLRELGYQWANVDLVPNRSLSSIVYDPRFVLMVKSRSRPEVFLSFDFNLFWISSYEEMRAWGLDWRNLTIVDDSTMGSTFTFNPTGTFRERSTNRVYSTSYGRIRREHYVNPLNVFNPSCHLLNY